MDISVVFFGSGPVAAASLELLARDFTVEAVITKPRPEHFKGDFPVIDWCSRTGAPIGGVDTVSNKKELSELFQTQTFTSRLGVVIDFGIIIAQDVIDAFPLGIINSHFSLLPQWRGADPISFSILSGQKQTGVSLMRITAGLDEGPLLATGTCPLDGSETTPFLTDKLIKLSHGLLVQELPRYAAHPEIVMSQEAVAEAEGRPVKPSFSRKLTKADGQLDFARPAAELERQVRAFLGWPGSRTVIAGRDVIITAAHVGQLIEGDSPGSPGDIWRSGKQLGFYTSAGILVIDRIKPAGKQEMDASSFIAGYKLI